MATRTRLTNDEKKAGLTVQQKKAGMTIKDLENGMTVDQAKDRTRKNQERLIKKPQTKKSKKSILVSKNTNEKPEVIKEVIKEVRILGASGTEKTVQEFLNEELAKCVWEWKKIDINKDFRLNVLNKAGKEGWKFAFIHETESDKSCNCVCLHRPKRKKK